MKLFLTTICLLGLVGAAQAEYKDYSQRQQSRRLNPPPQGRITPDAYGPGINSDATGRPFRWKPQGGHREHRDPFLDVKPNVYGPGTGEDQYGRPVEAEPWP